MSAKDKARLDWLSKRDTLRYGDSRWVSFAEDADHVITLRYEIDKAMRAEKRDKDTYRIKQV